MTADSAGPPQPPSAWTASRWAAGGALAAGFVFLLVFAYSTAARGPFVFDDGPNIVANPLIRDLGNFVPGADLALAGASPEQLGAMRPRFVAYLTFALDYQLWGLEPRGFRATNLLIHLLTSSLLYLALVRLFRSPRLAAGPYTARARPLAFAVAAIWAVHPIQTQSVTYIVQRMTSLAGLFCLAALVCYQTGRRGASRRSRAVWLTASVLFLATAMLTKQNALIFPVILLLYELTFHAAPARRRAVLLAAPLACVLIVPAVALYLANGGEPFAARLDAATRAGTEISRSVYAATQAEVVVRYVGLLTLPIGQNIDHDVPWRSWREPATAASAAALLALGGLGCAWSLRERSTPARRVVGFGVLWFFVSLAVESSWIPIADPMFEHRLYLPSIGFFLAIVGGFGARLEGDAWRRAAIWLAVLLVTLTLLTRARNAVWSSAQSLWQDAYAKSPQKARVIYNFGRLNQQRDDALAREQWLRRVLQLDPRLRPALLDLGWQVLERRDFEEAERLFRAAQAQRASDWKASMGLGDLECLRGRPELALKWYERAAVLAPRERSIRSRLQRLRADPRHCVIEAAPDS